MTQLQRCSNTG